MHRLQYSSYTCNIWCYSPCAYQQHKKS
ncbi:MAG: hypothetical protein HKN09_01630 [Saprospiraceae bacterium]|nr:hypothetical protein [Saprospiraceae bacterium]